MAVRYTKPLDGGFGWVVVLAVFMIGACTMGLTRSFGVFFKEFATQFNQPATATSWVISICTGTTLGGALVGVWLSTKFGFRPVAMVGGVVAGIGCILASFATSIVHLYLTVGILVGKLYDTTRDYDMSFVVAGCGPILGGLAAAVLCCLGDESARRVSGKESSSTEPIEEEPANLLNVDEKEVPVPFAIETSV